MNISQDSPEYNMMILREYVRICDTMGLARPVCCICGDDAGEYDEPLCDVCFGAAVDVGYWMQATWRIAEREADIRAYMTVRSAVKSVDGGRGFLASSRRDVAIEKLCAALGVARAQV